jgi:hypothetical protein
VLFRLDGVPFSIRIVVGERADGVRELDYAEHARMPVNSSAIELTALMEAFD